MKIVLTHGYFLEEDPKEKLIMRPYPPLGILYISAYLEQNNFSNLIYDSTFGSMPGLKDFLLNEQPDIIGIYTNLMTKLNVLKIISFVRQAKSLDHTKIILGGPEIRNHKERFLQFGADGVVFGEGEDTMLEVVSAIEKNLETGFAGIPGTAYLDSNKDVISNPERVLIKDINQLPFPARN